MGAGDFLFRIRGEADMSQIRSELQGIVAAAETSLAHLTRKAIVTGDTGALSGLAASGPGASTVGGLSVPGGSSLSEELKAVGAEANEYKKIYKLLRAEAQRALDLQKHITEGLIVQRDEYGNSSFHRVPLGQALGLDLSDEELAKATSLQRARTLTSLRPAGGFPGGSPGAVLESDIQARAQLVAGNDWLNATKRLAYSQYILSKEGEDILQVQAEEKAAFVQRIAAERRITNAILASDETYKDNEAAQRAAFQATQAQIKERTTKITGSNQGLQDSIVNENLAAQRVTELQKINVSRELLGLKRLELDETRPLITIIAERRRLDTLVNEELKRQDVLLAEQNAELRGNVAQTAGAGAGGGGGIFQRFLAFTKPGGADAASQPNLTQFLGSKLATTVGFAAGGALTYGAFSLFSRALEDVREFENHAAVLEAQLESIGQGKQFEGLKSAILDISGSTGQKASELADIGRRFVGEFQSAEVAAQAMDRAAKIAVVSGADLGTVAEAIQAGTKNFGASAKEIGDLAVQIQNVFGTPQKDTLQFFGQTAPVAAQFGFDAKSAAIIAGGLTSTSPSRTGASEAESLNRILPEITANAAKLVALQQSLGGRTIFDVKDLASGNYKDVLQDLLTNFDKLSRSEQIQLLSTLGASRVQKDAIALFNDRAQILDLLTGKQQLQGTVDDEFAKKQGTLKQKIAETGAEFRKFINELYDSGLGDLLKEIADDIKVLVDFLQGALEVFKHLPQPIRETALAVGALYASIKLIEALAKTGIISKFLGGLGGGGAAAAEGAAGASLLSRAGPAALAIGTRALPIAAGVGAYFGTSKVLDQFNPEGRDVDLLTKQFIKLGVDGKSALGGLSISAQELAGSIGRNAEDGLGTRLKTLGGVFTDTSGGVNTFAKIGDFKQAGVDIKSANDALKEMLSLGKVDEARRAYGILAAELHDKYGVGIPKIAAAFEPYNTAYDALPDAAKQGKSSKDKEVERFANELDKIDKTTGDPSALQQQYEAGDITLQKYREGIQVWIDAYTKLGLSNQANAKVIVGLEKQRQATISKAVQNDIDNAASLIETLGGANASKDLENLYLSALSNPALLPQERAKDIQKAVEAERQKFDDFVAGQKDAAGKLSALKAGWKLPKEITSAVYTSIAETDSAYKTFIAGLASSIGLTASAATALAVNIAVETEQSLHDVLVQIAALKTAADEAVLDQLNTLYAQDVGKALSHSDYTGDPELAKKRNEQQAIVDQDKKNQAAISASPDTKATKLEATPKEVAAQQNQVNDTAAADAKAYREALNALYQAQFAYDPIKLAQLQIDLANQHDRDAELEETELKRKAAHIRAQAERISADRRMQQAFAEIFEAQLSLAQAVAQAAGNTVEAAKKGLEIAYVKLLEIIQEDGGAEQAKRDPRYAQAQAAIVSQQRAVYDAQLKDREGTIEFNLSVKKITEAQALAQYQSLLANAALLHLTTESRRELQKKIFDLKQGLSQDLQFNLPSDLRLPTLYEARRFNETGGNYQDNRQISIVLHANSKFEGQQALNTIVSSLNAAPRFGTRPRSY